MIYQLKTPLMVGASLVRGHLYIFTILLFVAFSAKASELLSLADAIERAQQEDPWLTANQFTERAMRAKSIASGSQADPKLALGYANLPLDSWHVNQQDMTQVKLSVSQQFARGDSLAIKQAQLKTAAKQYQLLREDRIAELKKALTLLWLDAYLSRQSIYLIEQDRTLFEQLAEVASASYSHALGQTQQQDVIHAQLEILQLEDRLLTHKQNLNEGISALHQWLDVSSESINDTKVSGQQYELNLAQLPEISLTSAGISKQAVSAQQIMPMLLKHPAVMAIDIHYQTRRQGIKLARQSYKPQWGVSASYGYRADRPEGGRRSDLFSVAVTFDLPLFTEHKQDQQVIAAVAEAEVVKSQKLLTLKQMFSQLKVELSRLAQLTARRFLYSEQLLPQTKQQVEASLASYTHDDGDFSQVVKARISLLDARISALKINVEKLKTITRINYLSTQASAKAEREWSQARRLNHAK
ncbi:TolC family protein [Gayadomonas joobiniege]|uniref:TolC family protein n=1 Tax=Gayadomonas joobiniege TaxID=1234606 RepID=UPI001ED9999F|nr:TolC family protein [Gayadomonas joobiniege]